jgi:hypothetical protein
MRTSISAAATRFQATALSTRLVVSNSGMTSAGPASNFRLKAEATRD